MINISVSFRQLNQSRVQGRDCYRCTEWACTITFLDTGWWWYMLFFFAFSIASSFYGTQHAVRVINRDTGSTSWLSCVCLSVFVMRRVHFRIKWQNGSFHLCRLMFIRNYCTSSDVCLFCVFVYLHGGRIAQCTTMACEFYSTFCFYILEIVIIIMRCDTKIRIQLTNKWFFSYIQQLGRSSFGRMDR